ncbi:hypothetical protein SK128_005271, partial [Halocaridina rubra]
MPGLLQVASSSEQIYPLSIPLPSQQMPKTSRSHISPCLKTIIPVLSFFILSILVKPNENHGIRSAITCHFLS